MDQSVRRLSIRLKRQQGQTLVIALLILGVLLVLGLVFAALVNRNIVDTGRSKQRTASGDLAESGVRYAHYQLLNSVLGADWRPESSGLADSTAGIDETRDPDAYYLRPADPTQSFTVDNQNRILDRGGPDGLGAYARIFFDKGRALIRVRYAPADFATFSGRTNSMVEPGKARSFLVIETVGRAGAFKPNDPTFLLTRSAKYRGFASSAELRNGIGALATYDAHNVASKKMIAFASLGTIETARFITNKFNVSTAAEIGSMTDPRTNQAVLNPTEDAGLGSRYEEPSDLKKRSVTVNSVFGGIQANAGGLTIGSGTLYSNASLVLHGANTVFLDRRFGDGWAVNGDITPANRASRLDLVYPNGGTTATTALTSNLLDSRNPNFRTVQGMLRDNNADADSDGYPRGITRKEPPSILRLDPTTNLNRYLVLTRDSGRANRRGQNTGQYGFGEGVYVSGQSSERGDAQDEGERISLDGSKSLVQSWLNPNKQGGKSGGWNGPFYVPLGAYLKLNVDGFMIIRDSASAPASAKWRNQEGVDTGRDSAVFKLVDLGANGVWVINDLISPDMVGLTERQLTTNAGYIQRVQDEGSRFNGVIMFEGDVRVRGIIPTDKQIAVVSMGTIYIEGSIVKGTFNDENVLLSRPSKSMIALMAKDYVCVNTTQFFGPIPGEQPQTKQAQIVRDAPAAVELDLNRPTLTLQAQFLLNPVDDAALGSNRNQPQTWKPFSNNYSEPGSNRKISSKLLLQHSADNGGPTFLNVGLQPLSAANPFTPYLFDSYVNLPTEEIPEFNSEIRPDLNPVGGTDKVVSPFYGLTKADINAMPAFETLSVPIVTPTFAYSTSGAATLVAPNGNSFGAHIFRMEDNTQIKLALTGFQNRASKNYELARAAIVPHDIRIEAAIFAEEGSFFVIPGPPFNVNNRDTREAFQRDVAAIGLIDAKRNRYRNFGSMPETPFYNEPLAVRISLVGAIAENMPAPISQQAEWQRRWGWIPRKIGATETLIPKQWVDGSTLNVEGANPTNWWIPNLTLNYDPALALATADINSMQPIRTTADGQWILPPLPRMPVSPSLAYFGEVNP